MRLLRKLIFLVVAGGGGYALVRARKSAVPATTAEAPSWPPMNAQAPTAAASTAAASTTAARDAPQTFAAVADAAPAATLPNGATWVLPLNGECPPGYPVKGNDSSKIFHVPGGRSYDRTVPERCYANADDAIADGYRAAKA